VTLLRLGGFQSANGLDQRLAGAVIAGGDTVSARERKSR